MVYNFFKPNNNGLSFGDISNISFPFIHPLVGVVFISSFKDDFILEINSPELDQNLTFASSLTFFENLSNLFLPAFVGSTFFETILSISL